MVQPVQFHDSDPNVFGQALFEEWITPLAMRRVLTHEQTAGGIIETVVRKPGNNRS